MEELRLAASARGLMVLHKRKLSPFLVMVCKSGQTVGNFQTADEAMKSILAIEPLPVFDKPEEVTWHSDVVLQEFPRRCPNGHGPDCLCLDSTAVYLCAVPQCRFQAGCYGCCHIHYSQLKVFGDLTKQAIEKTALLAENGEYNLEHNNDYKRVISLKTVIPTDSNKKNLTAGEIHNATAGALGMSVVWTGTEYLLVDKDGIILDRVFHKEELFEEDEDYSPSPSKEEK